MTTTDLNPRMALILPAFRKLTARLGRRPTNTEISRAYGWTPTWVKTGEQELVAAGLIPDAISHGREVRERREAEADKRAQAAQEARRAAREAAAARRAEEAERRRMARLAAQETRAKAMAESRARREAKKAGTGKASPFLASTGVFVERKGDPRPKRRPFTINNHKGAGYESARGLPPGVEPGYGKRAMKRWRRWSGEDEAVYRHWREGIPPAVAWLLFEASPPPLLVGAGPGAGWEGEEEG